MGISFLWTVNDTESDDTYWHTAFMMTTLSKIALARGITPDSTVTYKNINRNVVVVPFQFYERITPSFIYMQKY